MQRPLKRFALTQRYVVSRVGEAAREHFLAEFFLAEFGGGDGGVVGRMGRMDDEETASFGCLKGGSMSESGFHHP